jgi:hypothetical protein
MGESAEDELHETCGGIRELSGLLRAKLSEFVDLGPDDNAGNVTRALPGVMECLLLDLANRLDHASPMTVEERADVAGTVFDILNALNTTSFGVSHVVGYLDHLDRSRKGATARGGKADLSKRDAKIIELAKAECKTRPTSGKSDNAMAGSILGVVTAWICENSGNGEVLERDALRKVLMKHRTSWKAN